MNGSTRRASSMVLLTLCSAQFLMVLDSSVMNVSISQLVKDFHTTVTVIQGLGTAYYTPLEQYGGDSGHTDGRTDIYAFGASGQGVGR